MDDIKTRSRNDSGATKLRRHVTRTDAITVVADTQSQQTNEIHNGKQTDEGLCPVATLPNENVPTLEESAIPTPSCQQLLKIIDQQQKQIDKLIWAVKELKSHMLDVKDTLNYRYDVWLNSDEI